LRIACKQCRKGLLTPLVNDLRCLSHSSTNARMLSEFIYMKIKEFIKHFIQISYFAVFLSRHF
jgi:hypothetical protein